MKYTYLYDNWNLLLETVHHSNNTTDDFEYFWGKDLSGTFQGAGGVGGLLAVCYNGNYFFPLYDHNGNITDYVDANGTLVAHYEYDAFGNTLVKNGIMADIFRHRFSTKYYDTETGDYYYGYRIYNPPLRRWLNRDPMGENGGINLYAFCNNNSIYTIDLLGLVNLTGCTRQILSISIQAGKLLNEIRKYDPIKDGIGGYPHRYGITKPGGHYKEINDLKSGLKQRLSDFVRDCMDNNGNNNGNKNGHFPRWADQLANVYVPPPVFKITTPMVTIQAQLPTITSDEVNIRLKNPQPTETVVQKANETEATGQIAKNIVAGAGIAVGVGGGCYLIYRGVRMIPSLAPPLWWTIPANLVAP